MFNKKSLYVQIVTEVAFTNVSYQEFNLKNSFLKNTFVLTHILYVMNASFLSLTP